MSQDELREAIDFYRRMFGVADEDFNTLLLALFDQAMQKREGSKQRDDELDLGGRIAEFEWLVEHPEKINLQYVKDRLATLTKDREKK